MVARAKKEGLSAETANALSQYVIEEFEFAGFGKLLAMTPSEKTNILACQLWANDLGRDNVFRTGIPEEEYKPPESATLSDDVQIVFPKKITQQWLQDNLGNKWKIKTTKLDSKKTIREFQEKIKKEEVYPLAQAYKEKVTFYREGDELNESYTFVFIEKDS